MKKLFCAALVLMTVSAAWAAQAGQHRRDARSRRSGVQENGKVLNPALRELAQGLAVALEDVQTRRMVKQEVGKKFDGDFEVLYRDLANRKVGRGRTFRQALGGAVGKAQKRADRQAASWDLEGLASAFPQLQISVPAGFESWDVEGPAPLVAFVPAGVDDNELRVVEAFDSAGRLHLLDAQVAPDFPVVAVGLNERTDRNGALRPEFVPPASRDRAANNRDRAAKIEDPSDPGGDVIYESPSPTYSLAAPNVCDALSHVSGAQEFLHQIKINNDHEPWIKNSPEIYATYGFPNNSQGIRGQFFMSNVDNEGQWYSINGPLFYWHSYYGNTFAMAVFEQDGSNWGTITFSFSGLSYTLNITDGDDSLGATTVSFLDPNCGSYSTGDSEFKLRYNGTVTTSGSCGEASCVPVQGTYVSHFSGPGCTGSEAYYLPYDGYAYNCRTWDGTGQCGTVQRTVTAYSARINGGSCQDLWPSGNTLTEFVTVYRGTTSGGCKEASCVPVQATYVSHFSGPGCTGTESYYLPYDGYAYTCRTWNGTGQCGTIRRTVTNYSARINGGACQDLWPSGNTLSDFVTIYR